METEKISEIRFLKCLLIYLLKFLWKLILSNLLIAKRALIFKIKFSKYFFGVIVLCPDNLRPSPLSTLWLSQFSLTKYEMYHNYKFKYYTSTFEVKRYNFTLFEFRGGLRNHHGNTKFHRIPSLTMWSNGFKVENERKLRRF